MKNEKILTILSVCCICLAIATAARADFVGVVSEIRTDADTMSLCGEGLGLAVCNFYAAFDHPGDKLLNIGNPATVTTTDPNGYFQHAMGGDTASQCALFEFPLFSDLGCDSFVTIGRRCSDDPGGDNTYVDPSWDTDEFNNNGHLLGHPAVLRIDAYNQVGACSLPNDAAHSLFLIVSTTSVGAKIVAAYSESTDGIGS